MKTYAGVNERMKQVKPRVTLFQKVRPRSEHVVMRPGKTAKDRAKRMK